jgi:hypothetical protein
MLTVLSMLPRPVREYIMPDMLIPPISNNPSKVQLVRLSHVKCLPWYRHSSAKYPGLIKGNEVVLEIILHLF